VKTIKELAAMAVNFELIALYLYIKPKQLYQNP